MLFTQKDPLLDATASWQTLVGVHVVILNTSGVPYPNQTSSVIDKFFPFDSFVAKERNDQKIL
jgi:hypothetical protein